MEHRVTCSDRSQWRSWLQQNHDSQAEAWLVYFRKSTGRPCVSYRESVEEALCFGWIDGLKKRIDEQRYAHRFTPRRPGSRWSQLNIRLAGELIERGLMTPAGQAAFDQRKTYDASSLKTRKTAEELLPPGMERELRANRKAWENYMALAPGYRRQYAGWLASAVRPETRRQRLAEALALLEQNKKLGMK